MKTIKSLIKEKYLLFLSLIFFTLLVGENYPFSMYPMYNHFPNWSYTFYFTDENGQTIQQQLKVNHSDLSHLFYSTCEKLGVEYGNNQESSDNLQKVGTEVVQLALNLKELRANNINKVYFKRIYNHLRNGSTISDTATITIYEIPTN